MKIQLYRYTHSDGRAKDWGIAVERVSHPGLGTESGVRVWFGKTGAVLQSRFIQADNPDGELCKRVRHKSHQGYQLVGDVEVDDHTGMVMATVSAPEPEPAPAIVQEEEPALYWRLGGYFMGLSGDRLATLATETGLTLESDEDGFTLVNPRGAHGLTRLCFPKTQTMAGVLVVPVLKDNPSLLLALLALGGESGVLLTLADEQGKAIEPALKGVLSRFGLCLDAEQNDSAQRLGLLPKPLVAARSFYLGDQVSVSLS